MPIVNDIFGFALRRLPENNRIERIWKLAQVDFKKRFYNDRLGLFWAFLNPVLRTLIYYFIFNLVFERSVGQIENYGLYIFSGLLIWMGFVENIKKGMLVLNKKRYLIENIQVQKIDLYISNSLAILLGTLFNLFGYIVIALLFGVSFSWEVIYLVLILLNISILGMGSAMILSTIYIFLKDINHILDILILIGFWSSGIFFQAEKILEKIPWFIFINPFLGIIDNMRNVALYDKPVNWYYMCIGMAWGILLFVIGLYFLRKYAYLSIEKR